MGVPWLWIFRASLCAGDMFEAGLGWCGGCSCAGGFGSPCVAGRGCWIAMMRDGCVRSGQKLYEKKNITTKILSETITSFSA